MASGNPRFLQCSSEATGVRLDISINPGLSGLSPVCCGVLREEHKKLRDELDELYKDYTILQQRNSDLQKLLEEGKEKEKRLIDLQGAVSDFVTKGLKAYFWKNEETLSQSCSGRVDQSPDGPQSDSAKSLPDGNCTEKLMSELDQIHKKLAMLEEEKRALWDRCTNGKGKELGLSPPAEVLPPDLDKVSQHCQDQSQSKEEDAVTTLERNNKELTAENQRLQSSVEGATMLAAIWEDRWRFCDKKRQRLEQCLQVLKQEQDYAEWDWGPCELDEGSKDRPVSSRFRKEVCQIAECQNCRRFFEGSEAEGGLCQYHTQRPLFLAEWQSLFPMLNHDAIMQYQDYRFWPCCGVLAKKTPIGCRAGQHIIKPSVNSQLCVEP